MSGWGSGYPGVLGDAAQKKAAAANAPARESAQESDETEDSPSASAS